MPTTFNLSVSQALFIIQNPEGDNTQYLDAYGNVMEANTYFDNQLRSASWKRSKLVDKKLAMHEATLIIDGLNFQGVKADITQSHQFPRNSDTTIPKDIKRACFEIAIKLIQGVDTDKEVELLSTTGHTFGGVKTTFDRSFVPDFLRAGIPSFRAWVYLKPFLRNPEEIAFTRV